MALSVDYSRYFYKWGSIRYKWLEFGEENGKRREVDDYLKRFSTMVSFVNAVCFDESTQLLLRYNEYNKAKTELERILQMDLPKVPNTRLSNTNPVVKTVSFRNLRDLISLTKNINDQNAALRNQQQRQAKEYEREVIRYIRDNPEAIFLILDVEMYEHDHSFITEVGFSVFKRNQYDRAECIHYIIAANRRYINKDHVPDNRDGFKFGTSIDGSLEEAIAALKEQLKRADAVVGHSVKEDEKVLEGVSLEGKFLIDTQKLAFAQATKPAPMSLTHVLETYKVPFDTEDLHNAGNDCHYTMKAFEALTRTTKTLSV